MKKSTVLNLYYRIFSDSKYIQKVMSTSYKYEHYRICENMVNNLIYITYIVKHELNKFKYIFIYKRKHIYLNEINNEVKLLEEKLKILKNNVENTGPEKKFICGIGWELFDIDGKQMNEMDPIDFLWFTSFEQRNYNYDYLESENDIYGLKQIRPFKINISKRDYFEDYDTRHNLFRYKYM